MVRYDDVVATTVHPPLPLLVASPSHDANRLFLNSLLLRIRSPRMSSSALTSSSGSTRPPRP